METAVPDWPTSALRLSASDSASLSTNTRATDSPACLPPPRSPFQLQPVTPLTGLPTRSYLFLSHAKCTRDYVGGKTLEEEEVPAVRISCTGEVFLLCPQFFGPAAGQDSQGRPSGGEGGNGDRMMWIWYLLLGSGSGSRTVGKFLKSTRKLMLCSRYAPVDGGLARGRRRRRRGGM